MAGQKEKGGIGSEGKAPGRLFGTMTFRFYAKTLSKFRDIPILERKRDEIKGMHVRNFNILVALCQTICFLSI